MEHEFEAKSIRIDKDDIRNRIKLLGAQLVFSETLFERATFENPQLKEQGAWIRLRKELSQNTLAIKTVAKNQGINKMKELSFTVGDFEKAREFIIALGFPQTHYQQNYREEWKFQDVVFDIDTWPQIDPYLEVEAPNELLVQEYFRKLNLNYEEAMFGSADEVYQKIYSIDILSIPTLTF